MPVYLTAAQAAAPAQLQIGYMNAVSVMPEGSSLTASINDVEIGQITIAAAEVPARARLDVPPGLLQPGYNAIRIRARQRHRVDCSLAGTYELWTELQPGITGLAFLAEAKGFETFADIAAVNPGADGAVHIRIRAAETRNSAMVARMLRSVEQAVLAAGIAHAVVDVDPAPAEGPGLEIAVGTAAEIAALGLLKAGQAATPGVSLLLPESMDLVQSRITILVSGATEAEIDRGLASLDAQIRAGVPAGTPAGLRALANLKGHVIEPGTPVTFRDLGVNSEDFNGRLYRAAMQIRMPYDYLSADYDKAALRLVAGYVPGLDAKSQLIVRVNGATASVLPMPRRQGEILRGREIPIPLRSLHPGVNRVELEAHLATPADESCDALAAMNAPSRFILMNNSELFIPNVARLAQMPDLASTMGAGFPYSGAERSVVFIPHPDREAIGAAATFAANMAAGAGMPLGLSVAFSAPSPDAGTALVVGTLRDLPPAVLSTYGLSADSMQQAWRGQMLAPVASIDQLLKEPSVTASTAGDPRVPGVNAPAAQPQAFNAPTVSLDDWSRDIQSRRETRGVPSRAWNWVREQVGLSRHHLGVYAGGGTVRVKPETTLVVAQVEAPYAAGGTWTLVTAPTGERLSASVAEIGDPALALPDLRPGRRFQRRRRYDRHLDRRRPAISSPRRTCPSGICASSRQAGSPSTSPITCWRSSPRAACSARRPGCSCGASGTEANDAARASAGHADGGGRAGRRRRRRGDEARRRQQRRRRACRAAGRHSHSSAGSRGAGRGKPRSRR